MLQGALPGACHCPQSAACWDGPPAEVAMRQTAVSKGDNYLRLADGAQRVERLVSPGFYTLSKLQALVYDTLPPNTFALGFTPCAALSPWVLHHVLHFRPGFYNMRFTVALGFTSCDALSPWLLQHALHCRPGFYIMRCTLALGFT